MVAHIFPEKVFINEMIANGWAVDVPDHIAIVSILYPNETHYFKSNKNILNIDFYDVNDYCVDGLDGLSDEQAKTIFEFIEKHIGYDFYVHCNAGASRSQAIGEFLRTCYGYDVVSYSNIGIYPNIHVLCLLKRLYRSK